MRSVALHPIGHAATFAKGLRLWSTIGSSFVAVGSVAIAAILVWSWVFDFVERDGWLKVLLAAVPAFAAVAILLALVWLGVFLHRRVLGFFLALLSIPYLLNIPFLSLHFWASGYLEFALTHPAHLAIISVTFLCLMLALPIWWSLMLTGVRMLVVGSDQMRAVRTPPPSAFNAMEVLQYVLGIPTALRNGELTQRAVLTKIAFGVFAFAVFTVLVVLPNVLFNEVVWPCEAETQRDLSQLITSFERSGTEGTAQALAAFDVRDRLDACYLSRQGNVGTGLLFVAGAILVAFLAWAAAKALLKNYRSSAVLGLGEALRMDRRPPVLFLRAFQEDFVSYASSFGRGVSQLLTPLDEPRGFEELVATYAGAVGPVIALGSPEQNLERWGAARGYYAEHEWRDVVRENADSASLIVLVLAQSAGVEWEIALLQERKMWGKALVFFSGDEGWQQADQFLGMLGYTAPRRKGMPVAMDWIDDGHPRVFWAQSRHVSVLRAALLRHVSERFGEEVWKAQFHESGGQRWVRSQ